MRVVSRLSLFISMAVFFTIISQQPAAANNYSLQKVGDGIYAALAQPGSKASSNVLIIFGKYQVIIAGAHFVAEGITELTREIGKLTPLPIRSAILTHHHKGFTFVDFDLPANIELIMSWQTWQALKSERRDLKNNVTFFDKGMTLVRDATTIVLTNTNLGHTAGDVIVYLPVSGVLFTSDLVFNNVIGYMGEGSMREWVMTLEMMEEIGATTVVPGVGKPDSAKIISDFKDFFREFLTEVIRLKAAGRSIAQAKKELALPARYKALPGYTTFINANLERAFNDEAIR
jgi:glyoxylase-like metal-dependent hydrolase (beta-lactamase superfamily II)